MPEHQALESRISNSPFKVLAIRNPKVVEKIIEGRITPASECYSEELNDPVFLRAQNVEEGYLNFSDAKRLSEEAFEAEPKAVLADGDLVLTIDGVLLGIAAIHRAGDQECCISNHMVRMRHGVEANPEFLAWLLNSSLGQKQIKRGISGSAIPGIRTDAIERILIPLPSTEIQRSLVAEIEAARQTRKQKLAQADELLSSLDAYLLDQLGLSAPEESDRKSYAVQLKQIKNGRYDSLYHEPSFIKIVKELAECAFPVIPLGDIVLDPVGGATPKRSDAELYADEGVKFLRILNIKPYEMELTDVKFIADIVHSGELARSQLEENDVLMTITGRVGTAAVVPREILPANINQHIVRLRIHHTACLPTYLAAYLNSSIGLSLSNRSVTGGTRIALDYEAIRSLQVPLPPTDIQEAVVNEVETQRSNAQRLRQEAETEWEAAKTRFEQKLLGEEA